MVYASSIGFFTYFTPATLPALKVLPHIIAASISCSALCVNTLPLPALNSILFSKLSTAAFTAKKADFIPVNSVKLPGGALKKIHIKYLKERGFDPEYLVKKYKLQGTTWLDFGWEYRIIIPIIVNGVVVAFQGRTVIDDKIRYKTSKNEESIIPAKNILYNMDNCKGRYAVIVEGAFDAMRIGDGVVATLGTGMTQAQKELIYEKYDEVTFLFDPVYEAQKRAEEHGNDLAALGVTVNICNMEWEHDPGSLTEEEIKKVRNLLKIY